MSDRDLLELAAKAAGLSLSHCDDSVWDDERADYVGWNPLIDDGDAFRLAVKLELNVLPGVAQDGEGRIIVDKTADPLAATRRAIVRAAAEIGRAIP